jgi:hypothetical protein
MSPRKELKMKKMLSVLLAAAALAGVGVAQADQAACVTRGMCDNINPEAGGDANGNYDVRLAEQRGLVAPGTTQAWSGGYGWQQPWLADGRWAQTDRYASQYRRTYRDRDGDGVANNVDRYPDDPRYR